VPEAVERLVLDLTAKSSEQRPIDAFDVYERLLPFLPPPGAPPTVADPPTGVPDPTLLYRRPNSPRPRVDPSPPVTEPAPPTPPPNTATATALRDAISDAWAHSNNLLADERYAQAAESLRHVIEPAAAALGPEHPRVLTLRQRRAAILVIGGDFRTALPEFDALAAAFARTKGPHSAEAMACVRQAAHCRAGLGQATTALRQFRQVLAQVRATEGDASSTALELRRDIAMLLLTERDVERAEAELLPLHDDLRLVYGPDHEETREIGDILTRIRLVVGGAGTR
jgi:hypothetical protein